MRSADIMAETCKGDWGEEYDYITIVPKEGYEIRDVHDDDERFVGIVLMRK
jgi:hypothetical protein